MRPRGDATSSPVTRYVGQCGRHSPHATHATSSSSSRCKIPRRDARSRLPTHAWLPVRARGTAGGRARACRSGRRPSLMRAITAPFGSATPNPSRSGAPASRSIQPPADCGDRARRAEHDRDRRRDVHGADADLGEPPEPLGSCERVADVGDASRDAPRSGRGAVRRAMRARRRGRRRPGRGRRGTVRPRRRRGGPRAASSSSGRPRGSPTGGTCRARISTGPPTTRTRRSAAAAAGTGASLR